MYQKDAIFKSPPPFGSSCPYQCPVSPIDAALPPYQEAPLLEIKAPSFLSCVAMRILLLRASTADVV